jgi:hypothetical protein
VGDRHRLFLRRDLKSFMDEAARMTPFFNKKIDLVELDQIMFEVIVERATERDLGAAIMGAPLARNWDAISARIYHPKNNGAVGEPDPVTGRYKEYRIEGIQGQYWLQDVARTAGLVPRAQDELVARRERRRRAIAGLAPLKIPAQPFSTFRAPPVSPRPPWLSHE